jgi:hypothetical protein
MGGPVFVLTRHAGNRRKKNEEVEIWANHPLTPSSQGRGIGIYIDRGHPGPRKGFP